MKRITPIVLSFFLALTIFISPIPTHAASYVLDGDYTFKDVLTLPSSGEVTYYVTGQCNGFTLEAFILTPTMLKMDTTAFVGQPYTSANGWGLDMWKTVTFDNFNATPDFYEWFMANTISSVVYCEGNGHEITDSRFDDICDVCDLPIREDLRLDKPTQCDGTWYCALRRDGDHDGICDHCGLPYVEAYCDGSACAWADTNFDTICDTCGYSLRNFTYNLLDFAYETRDEGQAYFTKAVYWLIVDGSIGNTGEAYTIYIAEAPFTYANSVLSSTGKVYGIRVSFNANGVPVDDGWTHLDANMPLTYNDPIDSGTDIEGFFPPPDPDTGGGEGDNNGSSDSDSGFIDGLDGLWDWLSSAGGRLKDIVEGIKALPSAIKDGLLEGIRGIFVPDTDYIQTAFNDFLDELKMKFTFDTDMFESLFQNESAVEDVYTDIDIPGIGEMHLKVFDKSFFVDGVTYFRPFVRGFIVLMLFLYHIRQFIGFFGYDSGVVAGRSEHVKSARESQKED